jgi:sugar transferase EpsL
LKRLFDIFCALILTMIFLIPMIIIACILLFAIGRPVFFVQIRPGFHGKPFRIYKFRTMNEKSDCNGKLLPDNMRLTKMGKFLRRFSFDELPQLFNVLMGNLSFVGPRPLLMEYLPRYTRGQARRHDVKPGITGWAQVNGRNAISWEEKFDLDIWYVDHGSFFLDVRILWLTVVKVLKREGIAADGFSTMPKFKGTQSHLKI